MTRHTTPRNRFAMFTPEGNLAVARLVKRVAAADAEHMPHSRIAERIAADLDDIAKRHGEVDDTAVREMLWDAVQDVLAIDFDRSESMRDAVATIRANTARRARQGDAPTCFEDESDDSDEAALRDDLDAGNACSQCGDPCGDRAECGECREMAALGMALAEGRLTTTVTPAAQAAAEEIAEGLAESRAAQSNGTCAHDPRRWTINAGENGIGWCSFCASEAVYGDASEGEHPFRLVRGEDGRWYAEGIESESSFAWGDTPRAAWGNAVEFLTRADAPDGPQCPGACSSDTFGAIGDVCTECGREVVRHESGIGTTVAAPESDAQATGDAPAVERAKRDLAAAEAHVAAIDAHIASLDDDIAAMSQAAAVLDERIRAARRAMQDAQAQRRGADVTRGTLAAAVEILNGR